MVTPTALIVFVIVMAAGIATGRWIDRSRRRRKPQELDITEEFYHKN